MRRLSKVIKISVLLGLLAACSEHPFSPASKDFLYSPKALEDVELMALCLSGELTAPDSLYNKLVQELEFIRSTYESSVPKLNQIKFIAPWTAGCLLISFDDATAALVSQGTYHAWDELNTTFHLKSIDTRSVANSNFVILYFEGCLNPRRLDRLYKVLPGVLYAEPNYLNGDGANVYPMDTEFGMTYLYYDGWGDCPAGCINKEFWYFSRNSEDRSLALVGHWLADQGPAPAWFAEARKNIELWRTF